MSSLYKLMSLERREPLLRKCLHKKQLKDIFLVIDWWGRAQIIVCANIPWLVILGSIRKQTDQALRSNLVSSTIPWPLHQLLLPGSRHNWILVLTYFNDKLWCSPSPLSFTVILPLLQQDSLRCEESELRETYHLGQIVPRSLTFPTLSICESVYLFPFTVEGSFSDNGWTGWHWPIIISECY